jgi:hypothetical protein
VAYSGKIVATTIEHIWKLCENIGIGYCVSHNKFNHCNSMAILFSLSRTAQLIGHKNQYEIHAKFPVAQYSAGIDSIKFSIAMSLRVSQSPKTLGYATPMNKNDSNCMLLTHQPGSG